MYVVTVAGATYSSKKADAAAATNSTTGAGWTCSTNTRSASSTGVIKHIGGTDSAKRGDPTSTISTVRQNSHGSSQTLRGLGAMTRKGFGNLNGFL